MYDDPDRNISGVHRYSDSRNEGDTLIECDPEGKIVINGNEKRGSLELMRQGAGMLVLLHTESVDPEVLSLAEEKHCPIILSGYSAMNTSRYLYLASPVGLIMRDKVTVFYSHELADDVNKKMAATRFRSYPCGQLIPITDRLCLQISFAELPQQAPDPCRPQ